jgi:hypothetical protein
MKLASVRNRQFHNNKVKFKFGFDTMQIMKCTYYLDVETFAKNKTLVSYKGNNNIYDPVEVEWWN